METSDRGALDASTACRRAWAACVLAIVYGSLIPFDFHAVSLDAALQAFGRLPWLSLGFTERADWIANVLLYVPLGFVARGALSARRRSAAASSAAIVLGGLVAIVVEFAQVYFPGRTQSLNDIVAEVLGTVIGTLGWRWGSSWLELASRAVRAGGNALLASCLVLYAATYVAVSLFPFDFVMSASELHARLASDRWGWLTAAGACHGTGCAGRLAVEAMLAAPLGVLLMTRRGSPAWRSPGGAFLLGIALGAILETLQLLLISGVSQGLSVLARGLGMSLGLLAWRGHVTRSVSAGRTLHGIAGFVIAAAWVYAAVVLNGLSSAQWTDARAAAANLGGVNWLPFYYHYYTTESAALRSTLAYATLYGALGVFWAVARARNERAPRSGAWLAAGGFAAFVAVAFETAKLFTVGKHADPTDVLIAFACAAGACALARRVLGPVEDRPTRGPIESDVGNTPAGSAATSGFARKPHRWLALVGLVLATVVVASLLSFPIARVPLLVGIACYAAALFRWPSSYLVVLPASLPVLDLAPWSGRFYWTEFDILLVATLAVRCFVRRPRDASIERPTLSVVVWLFALWLLQATLHGWFPPSPPDVNAFVSYYSSYNAWLASKGAFFALAFLPLLRSDAEAGEDVVRAFIVGLAACVFTAAVAVVWERVTFPGWRNFADDYRATGLVSAMHVGGAALDATLLLSFPAAVILAVRLHGRAARSIAVAITLLGVYALVVTFSRGAMAGLALEVVLLSMFFFARTALGGGPFMATTRLTLLVLLALCIAIPVATGSFARARFALSSGDFNYRSAHWRDSVRMLKSPIDWIAGAGTGRFPLTYYFSNHEGIVPATHELVVGAAGTVLRLGAGDPLYVEQIVTTHPGERYELVIEARGNGSRQRLAVHLCEKSLLVSFRCAETLVGIPDADPSFARIRQSLDIGEIGKGTMPFRRPVKLSLRNASDAAIDLKSIRLIDGSGRDVLENGDFAAGTDRWFFHTERHVPWHILNLPLHVLFEQGIVGVCVLAWLWAGSIRRFRQWCRVRPDAVAFIAGLAGCAVVGLFDSVVDTPRVSFLVFLVSLMPYVVSVSAIHDHGGAIRSAPRNRLS